MNFSLFRNNLGLNAEIRNPYRHIFSLAAISIFYVAVAFPFLFSEVPQIYVNNIALEDKGDDPTS